MQADLFNVIVKCLTEQAINRCDEMDLYYSLSGLYGEDNILTELQIGDDGKTVYFGCAIRQNGKWKVYNLAGADDGIVVKCGCRFILSRKVE